MTGPLILRERDGSEAQMTMARPDPPEIDYLVKRTADGRTEYRFVELNTDGVPVYLAAAGGHLQ